MARARIDAEELSDPTARTSDAVHVIPMDGRTLSIGLGVKESELKVIEKLAHELDVSRNSLMRWALRSGLTAMVSGKAWPQVRTTTTTKLIM